MRGRAGLARLTSPAKHGKVVSDPAPLQAQLQGVSSQEMVEARPVHRHPSDQGHQQTDRAIPRPIQFEIPGEVSRRLVCESGRPRDRLQLVAIDQRVDVPAAREPLDRGDGGPIAGRALEVVADDEQAAGPNQPAALLEKTRRIRSVHERLNRIREIGRLHAVRQVAIVALETHDAVRQAGLFDGLPGNPRLNRAQRDACAADGR